MKAFVYIWNDHTRDMHYIGVHKGSPDDGYICSQKTMKAEQRARPQDFTRQIICEYETYEEAREVEQALLESVDAARNPAFYNRHNGGKKFYSNVKTPLHKIRIGLANKGKVRSSETRARISQTLRLQPGRPHSAETKEKIRLGNVGRTFTEETRRKMSESAKQKTCTQCQKEAFGRDKHGAANPMFGRKHTAETKAKIAARQEAFKKRRA